MRQYERIFLFILLLLLTAIPFTIFAVPAGETPSGPELEKALQQELDTLVRENDFPGAGLAVVLPDDRIVAVASGKADIESGEKMTTTHRFFSGSIGKTYVAAVAMQLISQKKLDPDTPIAVFFKDTAWYPRLPNNAHITVRMLMNHTSGLPRYVLKKELWDEARKNPDKGWTPEERLSYILGDAPLHPAGEGWGYSDTNYIVLGMIIEKITGHPYYTELKQRILEPFKLNNTIPADQRRLPGLCAGYTETLDPFNLPRKTYEKGLYTFNPQLEWTGGGLITTPSELALWAKLLYGGKVLDKQSLNAMLTLVTDKPGLSPDFAYGLGVMAWKTGQGMAYGHGGFVPGYQSLMQFYPKLGVAVALQINTDRTTGKFKKSMEQYLPPFVAGVEKFLSAESKIKTK